MPMTILGVSTTAAGNARRSMALGATGTDAVDPADVSFARAVARLLGSRCAVRCALCSVARLLGSLCAVARFAVRDTLCSVARFAVRGVAFAGFVRKSRSHRHRRQRGWQQTRRSRSRKLRSLRQHPELIPPHSAKRRRARSGGCQTRCQARPSSHKKPKPQTNRIPPISKRKKTHRRALGTLPASKKHDAKPQQLYENASKMPSELFRPARNTMPSRNNYTKTHRRALGTLPASKQMQQQPTPHPPPPKVSEQGTKANQLRSAAVARSASEFFLALPHEFRGRPQHSSKLRLRSSACTSCPKHMGTARCDQPSWP